MASAELSKTLATWVRLSFQRQVCSRLFLRRVTPWIPRYQKLQSRELRHDRVSLKANQAVRRADRNVRPRLSPDQEVTQLDEVEDSQSTTQTRRDLDQTPDEVPVDNPPGAASSIPISYPLISASSYLTVLPVETEFDSKALAVVHGSVDAVTEQNSTTFEAIKRMVVFGSETKSFWVAPRPRDKSSVVYDELSDTDKKKSTYPSSRESTTC